MRYLTVPIDTDGIIDFPDASFENYGQLRIYPKDGIDPAGLYVCLQNADGTYSWVAIAEGTP